MVLLLDGKSLKVALVRNNIYSKNDNNFFEEEKKSGFKD